MDPFITGSLISAGSQLLGGLFGGGDNDKAMNNYWLQRKHSKIDMREQAALQREFAQNGIRWKVADAKAAGIHPLYALGAQTSSFNPISVSGGGIDSSGDRDAVGALADAGSSIGRAIMAKQTNMERLQERLLQAQIDGQEIDNAKAASDLRLTSGPMLPPSMPGIVNPSEGTMGARSNRGVEYMTTPGNRLYKNFAGGYMLGPNSDLAEAMEGMWPFGAVEYFLSNTLPYQAQRFNKWVNKWRR